jgi:hypothetical protein
MTPLVAFIYPFQYHYPAVIVISIVTSEQLCFYRTNFKPCYGKRPRVLLTLRIEIDKLVKEDNRNQELRLSSSDTAASTQTPEDLNNT